jgi:DNA-binding XRE family transcriptional regulator
MKVYNSLFTDHRILPNELFAYFVQHRRLQLRMTCSEAAELAGLPFSTWVAIESGWYSELADNLVFTIAGTLEVSADLIRRLSVSN